MANIKTIVVQLSTSADAGSGTNDHVYLGLVGRLGGAEFPLAVDNFNDFKEDDTVNYVLGEDPGFILDPKFPDFTRPGQEKDPKRFGIELLPPNGVERVYLRKQGDLTHDGDNEWQMSAAFVRMIDDNNMQRFSSHLGNVWLGNQFGLQLWLNGP